MTYLWDLSMWRFAYFGIYLSEWLLDYISISERPRPGARSLSSPKTVSAVPSHF